VIEEVKSECTRHLRDRSFVSRTMSRGAEFIPRRRKQNHKSANSSRGSTAFLTTPNVYLDALSITRH